MKYRNRKTRIYGKVLDSKKEARRYAELKLMEEQGLIRDLQTQVPFELIPNQYEPTGEVFAKGKNEGKPKLRCVERGVKYIADFVYWEDGRRIIEDTKGVRTKEYIIKRKLMRLQGNPIREL